MRLPRQRERSRGASSSVKLRITALAIVIAVLPVTVKADVVDRAMGLGVIGPEGGGGGSQGGWTSTSGVALSATYSDNADLTTTSEGRQEEIFLQVLPYFTLSGEGARVKAKGYYAPAFYTGTIGGTPADISNFLRFNGTVEVTPDTFFVDGFARASVVTQTTGGPGGSIPTGSYLYNSDNLTQAFSVGVSPYVRHRFGSTADFLARASFSTAVFAESSENNAVNGSFRAGLSSGSDFPRLPWSVVYSLSGLRFNETSEVNDSSNNYQSVTGRASYVISPNWRANTSIGYDINDYQTTSDNTSGLTWSLGGTWTPNPRLAVSLGYGWQPYGDSWYLDSRYSHKRVSLFANYSIQLTTVQQEFLESESFVLTDPNGLPVIDPATGLPVSVTRLDPTLTNETYVLSRFATGVNWSGNRTRVGLDANWNQRDYQVSGGSQQDWGIGARVSRTLSADLTASGRIGWTSNENVGRGPVGGAGGGGADDSDSWDASVLLTKRLSQRSSVSGIYRYISDVGGTGIDSLGSSGASGDENRVTLVFNHNF